MRRPDRLNRLWLTILGLLVLAAGVYGFLRSYGAFGRRRRTGPILDPQLQRFVADHRSWFWWAAAGVCVLIALLALLWLRAQFRTPRPGNQTLMRGDERGAVRVNGGAAADALAADVSTYLGVEGAQARISGDPLAPTVYLRVNMADTGDPASLRRRIESEGLDRLRRALQVNTLDAHLDLRVKDPAGRTVL